MNSDWFKEMFIDEAKTALNANSGSGGAFSWNDMPDKPFYEHKPFEEIVIDSEVTTGLETRTASNGVLYCKLYDKYIPRTDVESIEFSMGEGCITVPGDKIVGYNDDHAWIASSINVYASDGHETSEFPEGIWIVDFSLYPDSAKVVIKPKIVVKPIDTKFLPEHLQFGETVAMGDTLTWDGNTDGREMIEQVVDDIPQHLYKVSDKYIPVSDLVGAIVTASGQGELPVDTVETGPTYDYGVMAVGSEALGLEPGVTLFLHRGINSSTHLAVVSANAPRTIEIPGMFSIEIPSAGTYFADMSDCGVYGADGKVGVISSLTIPGYTGFPTKAIKPIDKKYLPDDVGGGTKIVVTTITEDDSGNLSCDKTSEELSEPYMNGATLRVKYNGMELPLVEAFDRYGNGEYWFVFGGVECFASSFRILAVKLKGSVVTKSESVKTPVVTADDNGKFLRVVNGAWAAATVPSAEEASF